MRVPVLSDYLARRGRRRLRQMMRGYRALRRDGRLDAIDTIKAELTTVELPPALQRASRLVLGSATEEAERSVRQYLMVRIGGLDFNRALLRHAARPGSRIVLPMPSAWRRSVERHGFAVAHWRSAATWAGYLFAIWGYGALGLVRQAMEGLRQTQEPMAGTAYFDRLAPANLPKGELPISHDILSWYARWDGRGSGVTALAHHVASSSDRSAGGIPIRRIGGPIPVLAKGHVAGFAMWSLAAAAKSLLDLLRGRWWHALLLAEAGKAKAVELAPQAALANDYLFHNSGWIYRPLWTYAAAARGARVLFYFYSTNCEVFQRRSGYPPQTGSWSLCNWPTYLVWDEPQRDFIERNIAGSNIQVVGPIWFSDGAARIGDLASGRPRVAVFDVQPVRDSVYQSLALGLEYYVPEVAGAFANDVAAAAAGAEAVLLWKRKREIGKVGHPRYGAALDRLVKAGKLCELDPALAAQHVIEAADVVISMPFTSTALIARSMGKPSCYYDPLARLQPGDRAAHGIAIIQSRSGLESWIEGHLKG